MRSRLLKTVFAAGSAAIVATSATAAVAAAPAPAPQAGPSGWLALSMLNTSGTVGLGDAAAQPARASDAPPPSDDYTLRGIPTPVIAFWVLTAATMIYLATRHSSGHLDFHRRNSPV